MQLKSLHAAVMNTLPKACYMIAFRFEPEIFIGNPFKAETRNQFQGQIKVVFPDLQSFHHRQQCITTPVQPGSAQEREYRLRSMPT